MLERWRPPITIEGSGGHGSADWSPDGTWIVAAGTDPQGSGLFKIPADGGRAVRLVSGRRSTQSGRRMGT